MSEKGRFFYRKPLNHNRESAILCMDERMGNAEKEGTKG